MARAIRAQDLTKLGLHIDYAHSISLTYSKEKYYLILSVDWIDFVWGQTCTIRSTPEDLIQEFLTMTNLKVSSVRFDGAQEFGKSFSFKSFCRRSMEPVAHYTYFQNARAENAIRVANIFAASYDRALEGIWFLMWSFKHKKVYTMSDPRHFDTILPFLQPGDGHKIDLTVDDIAKMHAVSASSISAPTTVIQTRSRGSSSLVPFSSTLTPSSDSGENVPLPDQGEQGIIQTSESSDGNSTFKTYTVGNDIGISQTRLNPAMFVSSLSR